MSVSVRIPTPLRSLTRDAAEVTAEGKTIREVIESLEAQHPGLRARLLDDKGGVRRYINIFLNDEDVRFGAGLDQPVKDGDKLAIVPAIAGG